MKTYPKLSLKDTFKFSCHKNLKCFTSCCADVNIFLTPYDVLRMKKGLKMTSEEFLAEYTEAITPDSRGFPAVLLKMGEDKLKSCPFVSKGGCTIYEDRPWVCRMYPLGMAPSDRNRSLEQEESYFIVDQEFPCLGFNEEREWAVEEWKKNQDVDEYELKGASYKEIVLHSFFLDGGRLNAEKSNMFHMACYDIDRFRRFIFDNTSSGKIFDIAEKTMENIKSDEETLLDFGYRWIRSNLFQEDTL